MDRIVYEEYYSKIYNYVFYRVLNRHDAEDITSEVFYKAAANASTYDSSLASYSTWLFTIAHNCVVNFVRDKKIHLPLEAANDKPADDLVDDKFTHDEEIKRLYELLATLSERDRTVLALRYWGEFSYKEISAQTGLSETNVSSIIYRSVRKLRDLWDTQTFCNEQCDKQEAHVYNYIEAKNKTVNR